MIKAVADGGGRKLVILGLSFANLNKFRAEPRDTFIKIQGEEMGLPVDIMIISGESDPALARFMEQFVGPDTELHVDPKLGDPFKEGHGS